MNKKKASKLKLLRVSRGLSQAEVAAGIGYSRNHYAKIESGVYEGKLVFWRAIKDFFGISESEMLELMNDGE